MMFQELCFRQEKMRKSFLVVIWSKRGEISKVYVWILCTSGLRALWKMEETNIQGHTSVGEFEKSTWN